MLFKIQTSLLKGNDIVTQRTSTAYIFSQQTNSDVS